MYFMYNCKVKHFKHGETQISFYTRPVITGKREKPENDSECDADRLAEESAAEMTDADRAAAHERSIQNSMKRALNKIYDIARANEWEYFITLTFSPDKVNRYDYSVCSAKLSQWLKDIKKRVNHDFRYLVVPERHKDGAFHFHGLIANCDGLRIVPSGHFDRSGKTIYNIGSYSLGFTTATSVDNQQAVNKYITKYVTKDLCEATKGKKKYWASRNCECPIEETFNFTPQEKHLLRTELIEDAKHYKVCEYDVGFEHCMSEYFENIGVTINIPEISLLA